MSSGGGGGQSITDRALAAKHTVAGQSLAKSICKATTEEVIGPKRKHLDHLLHCTNEPNVSIPQMANLLIERTQNSSWVVVFKALVTVHGLMNYGNERFTQFLASSNCTFHLDNFYDRGNGMQGYGMSTFIRRYAKYLNQKAFSYRQMAFDFCRAKRGKEDGVLRSMNTEQLLKALPLVQIQFDALIEFEATAGQVTNGVISAAFMLLFKDLIRLYACYNDGIINLLGLYFDMNKKNCREAFEIYKLFITRVDKVSQFFKVAESIGVDRGDIPDLAKAPASLLEALEQHLSALENTKKTAVMSNVGVGSSTNSSGYSSAEALHKPSVAPSVNSAHTNASSGKSLPTSAPVTISEAERRRILEEEERMLEMIKQQNLKQSAAAARPPPITTAPAALAATYGVPGPYHPPDFGVSAQGPAVAVRPGFNPFSQLDPGVELPPVPLSYDLLGLQQPLPSQSVPSANGFSFSDDSSLFFPPPGVLNPSPVMNASPKVDPFGNSSLFSGFDQTRKESVSPAPLMQAQLAQTHFTGAGVAPTSTHAQQLGSANTAALLKSNAEEKSKKLITGDLDASLATIAGNLSIRTPDHYKRMDHNWNGPTEKRLTGATGAAGNSWAQGSSSPPLYPRGVAVNMVGMQPSVMAGGSQYSAMMTGYPVVMGQPVMMSSTGGMMPVSQAPDMFSSQSVSNTTSTTTPLPPNDPFGAL